MSIFKAKQQICVNITEVRCLASYAAGKYCLRFTISELGRSPYSSKYAIPVSVIDYKSRRQQQPQREALYDIDEEVYSTKPFLLKPGSSTAINQLCVFKNQINIFNSRYETDFHDIVMRVLCELVCFDYGSANNKSEGRVVGTFQGRLRGAGVNDCLMVDFGEGVACQVLGSVHSFVYQFEYAYVGTPVRKDGRNGAKEGWRAKIDSNVMKESLSNEAAWLSGLESGEYVCLNFQLYCQLQSKQYVESLLEYLLAEVKKSQDKININLQLFHNLCQNPGKKQTSSTSSSLPKTQNQPQPEPEPQETQADLEFIQNLQRSIRTHSNIDLQSKSDTQIQERLSIIRQEYEGDSEGDDSVEMEIDQSDMEVYTEAHSQARDGEEQGTGGYNYWRVPQPQHHYHQQNSHMTDAAKQQNYQESDSSHLNPITRKRKRIFKQSPPHAQTQHLSSMLSKLQLEQNQPVREIPTKQPQGHPNKNSPGGKKTTPANKKQQEYKCGHLARNSKVERVSIAEFQKILHENCINIYEKWRKFLQCLTSPQAGYLLAAYLSEYRSRLLNLLNESVVRFKGDLHIDIYSKQEAQRNKMAMQIRTQALENQRSLLMNQFRFYSSELFNRHKPVMFEQVCEGVTGSRRNLQPDGDKGKKKSFLKVSLSGSSSLKSSQNELRHIVFLVHGLGACRLDMEKLKVQLKRSYDERIHLYSSCSNEARTEGDIAMMGVRLANQVDQQLTKHLSSRHTKVSQNFKISFIGHSMGGVIIRSALPRLEKYCKNFHSYVSLASPHVGYNYSSSKLVDVGLWLINNWKKCESILQLTMSDLGSNNKNGSSSIEQTFLYKLSQEKGLEWFKKVSLLASRQDLYVPYFSARVQKPEHCLAELKNKDYYATIHSKMVDNILSRITGTLTRVDVNFSIPEQNIDNIIGRAAHINFVNNQEFLRLLAVVDAKMLLE